jgi:acetyl esterase/lipase
MRRATVVRHTYGADPSQFAELHLPTGGRRRGTVVLLHGGWWAPEYGADNLDGVAADLAERGWVAWNVEYRRLELGGGYQPHSRTSPWRSTTSRRSKT